MVSVLVISASGFAHEEKYSGTFIKKYRAPNTLSETWREIKEHEKKLGEIIEAGDLKQVHKVAFEIRDLSKALPEKSEGLPHRNFANLKSAIEKVKKVTDYLDRNSDYGDRSAAKSEFIELGKLLQYIEDQYPKDFLEKTQGSKEQK